MRPKLTIDEARHMDYQELVERADALIADYEAPGGNESGDEADARLGRTIDELPDLYRWFLTLHSYFIHWTDAHAEIYGGRSKEYKAMRNRRDAMENASRAAKLRYEGASRLITIRLNEAEAVPRGRS